MTTPINKVLTNQTQTLSNEELANVSASLSAILGQGGGTYTGDGQYIDVENNTITLTQTAASLLNSVEYKLDTDIYAAASGKWEDVASAYQTYSGGYLTESATSAMYYPLTGNPSGFMDGMFMAKYGETTIAELDSAYNANQIVYCMVPTGTTGTRLAFLAFINTKNASEACYEFQYYISTTSKSMGSQSDQVIIYSCMSATGNWTSGTRNTNAQIVANDGLSAKMSDNKLYLGVSADYALKSELPDLTDYATKTYANDTSANALSEAETWVGQQNFATSAGLTANKQFAMTTTGWKEIQGGGGGTTYTPGDCIDITNDVISFDGVVVDAAEHIIAGNGTTENPLSTSAFANALNLEIDDINDAISDLADEVAALGGTIVLRGRASCQWLQNIQASDYQTGDAYIATDSGQISSYNHETGQWDNINVSTGDMVVLINYNNQREVAVLSTTPDLATYAQKTELPIVEAGANVVVTETTMSTGAKKYTVASLGGGGSSDMAYLVNSNDPRISVTQTYTPSPECKTFTLSANMPQFEAVTAMPGTTTPNTYYFVYEE